jgi:hypothetical protein
MGVEGVESVWPRRWQLRLRRLRGHPAAGLHARHHQWRHAFAQRQLAGQAVPALGHEQVPKPPPAARVDGDPGDGRTRQRDQPDPQARTLASIKEGRLVEYGWPPPACLLPAKSADHRTSLLSLVFYR